MLHFTIRSIRNKHDELLNFLNSLNLSFSVIGLSETWLTDKCPQVYDIPTHNFITKNRKTRNGGGVGIISHYTSPHEIWMVKLYLPPLHFHLVRSDFPGKILHENLSSTKQRPHCLINEQSINQSTLFKHGRWLSKLVFRHAMSQLQIVKSGPPHGYE